LAQKKDEEGHIMCQVSLEELREEETNWVNFIKSHYSKVGKNYARLWRVTS
jgi:hypothetical protein